MKFLKFTLKIALFCAFAFALFLILDALYPLNLDMLNKQKSRILYDRNGEILNMQISDDQIWRFYAAADEIPPRLKQSAIYFEDRYFYYHFGVNPASILRAATYNFTQNFTKKSEGNVERVGASTITMQVARMMRPKQRSYKNKIIEIFNAFQLEWHFSKDEILGMYFNLAPYGGNIEGVKTAAYFYFKKDLRELSNAQIALLSVIPKNPNKNRLDRRSNINALKNRLISQLREGGVISQSEYERALAEPFSPRRYAAPNYAPHYALLAFNNYKMQNFTAKDDVNFTQNLKQGGTPGATAEEVSLAARRAAAGAESNFSDAASAESSFTAATKVELNLSSAVNAQVGVDLKEMNPKEADFKTDAPKSLNLGGTSLNLNEREGAESHTGAKPNKPKSIKQNEREGANLDEWRDLINAARPSQNT
ncbi:transglycosylase domain-containing protein, partial [uncultured Campylobacter sp.]|uniref:transglycosylase domain-containing protein n=1 Tax=uncultured Campylobacter sp. TaxID=218934 RepID=UPI002627FA49